MMFDSPKRKAKSEPKDGVSKSTPKNADALDLSQFNDPATEQTGWIPLARTTFQSFMPEPPMLTKSVNVSPSRLELRGTFQTKLRVFAEGAAFSGIGLFGFSSFVYNLLETGVFNMSLQILVPLILLGAAGLFLIAIGFAHGLSLRPLVIDKQRGRIWNRWSLGGRWSGKRGEDPWELSHVHAVQLLPRLGTHEKKPSLEYDVNLVFKNGSRVPVLFGRNLCHVRGTAQTFANFLGKPLWDVAKKGIAKKVLQRSFFKQPSFVKMYSLPKGMRMKFQSPLYVARTVLLVSSWFALYLCDPVRWSLVTSVMVNLVFFQIVWKSRMLRAFFLTKHIDIIGETLSLKSCFLGIPFRTKSFQLNESTGTHPLLKECLSPSKNFVTDARAGIVLQEAEPIWEIMTKYLSDIYRFKTHAIKRIVFGECERLILQSPSTFLNPDVTELTTPFVHLKRIDINTASYDYARVERFLTYAVNYMDRRYLSKHVDVYVYEEAEALPANLYNNLKTLCRQVTVYQNESPVL